MLSIERHLVRATIGVIALTVVACTGPTPQVEKPASAPVTTPVRPELAPPDWSRRSYSAPFATPVRPELASSEWIRENYRTSDLPDINAEVQVSK